LFGVPTDERETLGYEIHLGETICQAGAQPVFELRRRHAIGSVMQDGAQSADGRIWGTYVHGLFDQDSFRHAFLKNARMASQLEPDDNVAFLSAERQERINRLADCVETVLDMDEISEWIKLPVLHFGLRQRG
jgi:adenosylcobyric acid synthase